jgi:hypothetical protein
VAGVSESQAASALTSNPGNNHDRPIFAVVKGSIANQYRYSEGPVTPRDDQARVVTPAEAIAAGATHIVVGRPITEAEDPAAEGRAILGSWSRSSKKRLWLLRCCECAGIENGLDRTYLSVLDLIP